MSFSQSVSAGSYHEFVDRVKALKVPETAEKTDAGVIQKAKDAVLSFADGVKGERDFGASFSGHSDADNSFHIAVNFVASPKPPTPESSKTPAEG